MVENAVRIHDVERLVDEGETLGVCDTDVSVQSLERETLAGEPNSPGRKIDTGRPCSLPHPIHEIRAGTHSNLEHIFPSATREARKGRNVRLPGVTLLLQVVEEAGAVVLRNVSRAARLRIPMAANALLEGSAVARDGHLSVVHSRGQNVLISLVSGYPGKRLFDLLLTTVTTPLWAPVVALLALVVRVRLGAPAFFVQTRPGLRGAPFQLIKLRTMSDARDATGVHLPDAARLTPLGQFLRSTSLDELPELWNVFRGDMSLVGPRPLLMKYLPLYNERHRRRHDVRPGITGMAQVSGRNAITWPEKLDLDVEYVTRCSFLLDLRILWRSARAVLRREGISAEGQATMPEFTGYDRA